MSIYFACMNFLRTAVVLFGWMICSGLSADSTWVKIEFKTDNQAFQNRWELYDSAGQLLMSRTALANQTTYVDSLEYDKESCLLLKLYDLGNDGLSSGHFKLWSDLRLEIDTRKIAYADAYEVNCPEGASCLRPIDIADEGFYSAFHDNTWYRFIPPSYRFVRSIRLRHSHL